MNFTFHIISIGGKSRRCQFYTILKDGEELSEASKFLANERNQKSEDFGRLKTRFDLIRNRVGARIGFFKPEGIDKHLVYALHAGVIKNGYLQVNTLRWYCIRLSDKCVIFGNGGVKQVAKTQQDPHLKEKEADMRFVEKCLDMAFKRDDIICDDNGNLIGDLVFTAKRLEEYGLQ